MTGIYGNSQEDKYMERKLDLYLNERQARDDAEEKEEAENNYKFPEYLNNNKNFVQLIKFMTASDLSSFVYFIGIMADEKEEMDCRHWASDQLNAFLNELLNRGE